MIKIMKIIFLIIIRVLGVGCVILIILFIRSLFLPLPIINDPIDKTKLKMFSIAELIFDSMEITDHDNVLEYISNSTSIQTIPQILNVELIRSITDPNPLSHVREPLFAKMFLDAWKQPIIITLTTNHVGKVGVTMHSFGKNKRNDNGNKDDVVLWFDSDMYHPNCAGGAYMKRLNLLRQLGVLNPNKNQINDFTPPYSLKTIKEKP